MPESLAFYVTRLQKDFSKFCKETIHQLGLSTGLMYFLIYIGKDPGCTPGIVAAALHADTGHTTRSVDKLVELGYVRRERSPNDQRAFLLSLTHSGLCAFEKLQSLLFQEWDEAVCKTLSPEQKQQLFDLLATVLRDVGEQPRV